MWAIRFVWSVVKRVQRHKCVARAAQLAYSFLFALFPFLLFLTTLLGYLPVSDPMGTVMGLLATFVPHEVLQLLQENIQTLVTEQRGELLSFGILGALWLSASAVVAVGDVLNEAYGVTERRPFWKVWGEAGLLTIGLSGLFLFSTVLLIFGPQLGAWLAGLIGLGNVFEVTWNILRWPVVLFFANGAVALLYHFAPDVKQEWKWITPGGVFAVLGWTIASLGFAYYVNDFASYNKTYGTIGTIIVLLTWLYLTGLVILIGGEINSETTSSVQTEQIPTDTTL